jgi:queuosine precursor transporter
MNQEMPAPPGYRYFAIIGGMFLATLLISNIAAQKLIPVGPFVFTGGILLFPITYIFGDVLTEVYGYAKTRQIIWTGFGANILMASFLWLVVALPPAPGWELQEAFASALGLLPRVVVGSIAAYWVGEFVNSLVMAKMKVLTGGRFLWSRTISSTLIGQLMDTVVFVIIAFAGVMPASVLIQVAWSGYLFKVLYEALATPITYAIVGWLKRVEEVDVYDRDTNFNPFILRIAEKM